MDILVQVIILAVVFLVLGVPLIIYSEYCWRHSPYYQAHEAELTSPPASRRVP